MKNHTDKCYECTKGGRGLKWRKPLNGRCDRTFRNKCYLKEVFVQINYFEMQSRMCLCTQCVNPRDVNALISIYQIHVNLVWIKAILLVCLTFQWITPLMVISAVIISHQWPWIVLQNKHSYPSSIYNNLHPGNWSQRRIYYGRERTADMIYYSAVWASNVCCWLSDVAW